MTSHLHELDTSKRPTPDLRAAAQSRPDPIGTLALLDEPNRRRLYEFVATRHSEVGRDEAAAALGISRELAAFHLDRLVDGGLLATTYRRLSGRAGPGAGRPAKLYQRSEREIAVSFPARRYERAADLFAEGLERLRDGAGVAAVRDTVAAAARARGRDVGIQARRAAGRQPTRRRLRDALLNLLGKAGFEPEADRASGAITLCNCPYRSLSQRHRDLTCGMNLAWARGVIDGLGDAELAPEPAPAPGRCCVVFAAEA